MQKQIKVWKDGSYRLGRKKVLKILAGAGSTIYVYVSTGRLVTFTDDTKKR